ncbi:SPOR domain-containing protein [Thiolapillus sp.]
MDEQLKRRLIGASVLIALAIIFLPMLLSHKPVAEHPGKMASIPDEPVRGFDPALLQDIPPKTEPPSVETPPVSHMPEPPVAAAPPTPVAPVVTAKPEPLVVAEKKPETKPEQKAEKKPETKPEKKPAAPKPSSSPSAWVVQVASLSSRASAERLVKKLRKAGLDTMDPAAVTVAGKKYYRVRVGPELDKQRAQRLLPRINKISGVKGQVVRYP